MLIVIVKFDNEEDLIIDKFVKEVFVDSVVAKNNAYITIHHYSLEKGHWWSYVYRKPTTVRVSIK